MVLCEIHKWSFACAFVSIDSLQRRRYFLSASASSSVKQNIIMLLFSLTDDASSLLAPVNGRADI